MPSFHLEPFDPPVTPPDLITYLHLLNEGLPEPTAVFCAESVTYRLNSEEPADKLAYGLYRYFMSKYWR